jgi:hypothetical protein
VALPEGPPDPLQQVGVAIHQKDPHFRFPSRQSQYDPSVSTRPEERANSVHHSFIGWIPGRIKP